MSGPRSHRSLASGVSAAEVEFLTLVSPRADAVIDTFGTAG